VSVVHLFYLASKLLPNILSMELIRSFINIVAGITSVRSLQYKFKTIETATNNFSERLGHGGSGHVFKVSFL